MVSFYRLLSVVLLSLWVCLQPAVLLADEGGPSRFARAKRACKSWFRFCAVDQQDLRHYGLRLDRGWQQTPVEHDLVVYLHGYNSTPQRSGALLKAVRAAGLPCASFAYPNDHALDASARLLAGELAEFAASNPQRKVSILAHSMGGLVARACVENPELDPGNVRRLVLIAPPNAGSEMAHLAVGADLWEHCVDGHDLRPWRQWKASIVDGLGEAANDLKPGSHFLARLNRRGRNPRVRYTVLLGNGASVEPEEMETACRRIEKYTSRIPWVRGQGQRLSACLDDLDEIVAGRGDGVVAVKRGRLPGVVDTLVLNFDHLSVVGPPESTAVRWVHRIVIDRLTTGRSR